MESTEQTKKAVKELFPEFIKCQFTAVDLLNEIDEKFYMAKRHRLSRMSVEWGKWSRQMNLYINDRLKTENDPEHDLLMFIINFWVIRSQLLELHHKSKVGSFGLKRKLRTEANQIRKIVLSGKAPFELKIEKVAERLLQELKHDS